MTFQEFHDWHGGWMSLGNTHEGQRSLVDVAAGPGVPVDLGGRPGHDARPALPLGRLEARQLPLDQRHGAAALCWLQGEMTTPSEPLHCV